MPLPRYQPLKKLKVVGPSINDLDDACISRILGYVLEFSSLRDDGSTVVDNGSTERNLSLVSKRWYFLTQTQIADRGVHRVNLDSLSRQIIAKKNYMQPIRGRGGILTQRNVGTTNISVLDEKIQSVNDIYSIDIFRKLQPRLRKYKHLLFEGALPTNEFKKLVMALNAARTEKLELNVLVEKRWSLIKDPISLSNRLPHLEKLILHWNLGKKNSSTNEWTWRVYERATNLRILELHAQASTSLIEDKIFDALQSDSICSPLHHPSLERLVFTWSPHEPGTECPALPLIKNILLSEGSVTEVETNDQMFIEYLINSSDRVCTTHRLKHLKLLAPIRDIHLLSKLLQSSTLGTERLSIEMDDIELLNEVRVAMEHFGQSRSLGAFCRLTFSFRDQKFTDCEDKIKTIVHLSRMADLVIHVEAQQRISIDCCHLMWSVGRALQGKSPEQTGRCLFKITITGINPSKFTEVTVPFGQCRNYSVNPSREDLNRHREIMKSLKKDCYHQFVKSVRGNLSP